MDILGIKFAPLNLPLKERLLTLAAFSWISLVLFGGIVCSLLSLYLIIYTRYGLIVGLYLFWIWVVDRKVAERGGRLSRWSRTWPWWKYMGRYFPIRVAGVPGAEFDAKKNYLLCCFPHGVFPAGASYTFIYEYSGYKDYFPHHTSFIAMIKHQFFLPFTRDLALAWGSISASSKSIEYILGWPDGGKTCTILIGGAQEACYCKPGTYKLYLMKRKGFVRLALRHGAPIVPVFSFGETDLYDQMEGPVLRRFQEFFRKWIGLVPIVVIGRGFFQYSFGIIPRKCPVTTVIGKPMEVPKIEEPTTEQINKYHGIFVEKLTELFEQQKYNYLENPEDKKLIIE